MGLHSYREARSCRTVLHDPRKLRVKQEVAKSTHAAFKIKVASGLGLVLSLGLRFALCFGSSLWAPSGFGFLFGQSSSVSALLRRLFSFFSTALGEDSWVKPLSGAD